jgi:hypothetical protein
LRELLGFLSGDNEDDPFRRCDALDCKHFAMSWKKILRPSAGSMDSSTTNIILFDMTFLQQLFFSDEWKPKFLTLRNNGLWSVREAVCRRPAE